VNSGAPVNFNADPAGSSGGAIGRQVGKFLLRYFFVDMRLIIVV